MSIFVSRCLNCADYLTESDVLQVTCPHCNKALKQENLDDLADYRKARQRRAQNYRVLTHTPDLGEVSALELFVLGIIDEL